MVEGIAQLLHEEFCTIKVIIWFSACLCSALGRRMSPIGNRKPIGGNFDLARTLADHHKRVTREQAAMLTAVSFLINALQQLRMCLVSLTSLLGAKMVATRFLSDSSLLTAGLAATRLFSSFSSGIFAAASAGEA